ncbi:MAG: ribosomal protein S18-alanine N-acetyltransferase [Vicinamibacterales bacterium]
MSEIVIERLSGLADLEGLLDIERASFNNPTSREWYERELGRPDVCFIYVLRLPARPVAGFCTFWRVADQIHINNLAVHPEHRRGGLGRHLLARVLEEAERMGAPNATLEVRRSNEAAQRLYDTAGFRVTATRTGYYTQPIEDALILWRTPRIP